jgi:hypothetical protein
MFYMLFIQAAVAVPVAKLNIVVAIWGRRLIDGYLIAYIVDVIKYK